MVRSVTVCALVGALLLSPARSVSAQTSVDFVERSNWLAGYVVNAPQQLLGFGAATVLSGLRGFGFYVDFKLTTDSPAGDRGFESTLTVQDAEASGDLFFRDDAAWTSVNVAAVKGVTEDLAVYLGGGPSWRTFYSQFEDPSGERGFFGFYWVEDDFRSQVNANFIGGAFFRMGRRLVTQFGAQTAPAGFTVGVHLLIR